MSRASRLLALFSCFALALPLAAQVSYNWTGLPASGGQAISVASADFNRDGFPDIVGGTNNAMDVCLATGKGQYGACTTYALPFTPNHIETPDLNNDGYPDLVLSSATQGAYVVIFLNNGDGTFTQKGVGLAGPGYTQSWVAAGDLNNDGNVDLVVREDLTNNSQFVIFPGKGGGTFTRGQVLTMAHFSSRAIVEDFNGDGILDIANVEGTKALIWPGKGNGTFGVPTSIAAPTSFDDLAAADFNNDGKPDLAFVWQNVCGDACPGPNNNQVYVYKNHGSWNFTLVSTTDFGGCSGAYLVPADVNGDGNIDLTVVGPSHFCGFAEVGLGNGAGSFPTITSAPSGDVTSDLFYRDLNLDSRHDIVLADLIGGSYSIGLASSGYTNCPPPNSASIAAKICSPTTTAPSTFILHASGNSPSGIKRLEVWIDGVKQYQRLNDQLARSFTLTTGTHRVVVVAVDKYEGTGKTVENITVQ